MWLFNEIREKTNQSWLFRIGTFTSHIIRYVDIGQRMRPKLPASVSTQSHIRLIWLGSARRTAEAKIQWNSSARKRPRSATNPEEVSIYMKEQFHGSLINESATMMVISRTFCTDEQSAVYSFSRHTAHTQRYIVITPRRCSLSRPRGLKRFFHYFQAVCRRCWWRDPSAWIHRDQKTHLTTCARRFGEKWWGTKCVYD